MKHAALGILALVVAGCSTGPEKRHDDPTLQRLQAVARAYGRALASGKTPTKLTDLEVYLKEDGDPAELTRSSRDQELFVILWGTRFTEPEPRIYAHEKTGKDGKRFVLMTDGAVYELTEEKFRATPKVP